MSEDSFVIEIPSTIQNPNKDGRRNQWFYKKQFEAGERYIVRVRDLTEHRRHMLKDKDNVDQENLKTLTEVHYYVTPSSGSDVVNMHIGVHYSKDTGEMVFNYSCGDELAQLFYSNIRHSKVENLSAEEMFATYIQDYEAKEALIKLIEDGVIVEQNLKDIKAYLLGLGE